MYKVKDSQEALNQILFHGAKIIPKAEKDDFEPSLDKDVEKLIIYSSYILKEKYYKYKVFIQKIVTPTYKNHVCSKYIIQQIFLFIIDPISHIPNIKEVKDDIINTIDKLKKQSRFYDIKEHLKKKVESLHKIKSLLIDKNKDIDFLPNFDELGDFFLPNPDKRMEFPSNEILNHISQLRNYNVLLLTRPQEILNFPNFYPFSSNFFTSLKQVCNNLIEHLYSKTLKTNPSLSQVKEVIDEIKLFKIEANLPRDINILIDGCLKILNKMLYLLTDSSKNLKKIEKKRINDAYSIENFEITIDNFLKTIEIGNSFLENAGDKRRLNDKFLIDEKENLKSEKVRLKLLNKVFWDKCQQKIRNRMKNEFSRIKVQDLSTEGKIIDAIAEAVVKKE